MRFLAIAIFALLARTLSAQVAAGAVSGTITDPSGNAIANSQVTIEEKSRNEVREITTNQNGLYNAPNLSPGTYDIRVSAPGFATLVQSNVVVDVGSAVVANLQLQLGTTRTTVEVTAAPPAVEAASSSVTAVVGGTTVRQLPLNGRDWTSLASLEPGVSVVRTENSANQLTINRTNRGLGTQMTINGNRPQQNNYRLDGVSVNDQFGGSPGSSLGQTIGVDAVQEFSVVSTNAPADYGKNAGAVVNAVTRSGTNDIHGSAYEFLRNSALDARNFFDLASAPPFRRNQFGGSVGLPIVKNKTFFFVDYEGLRQSLGTSNVISVPSAAARSGHLASGKTITVNPKAALYLNDIYPLPNGPVSGDIGTYSFSTQLVSQENFVTTRVDQRFSDRDNLHGVFLWDNSQTSGPDAYNAVDLGIISQRRTAQIEQSHLFSPAVINIARLGFNRNISSALDSLGAINPAAADPSLGFVPGRNMGSILIGGVTTFNGGVGAAGQYVYHYNSYQVYDDLFWTTGGHALKFGAAFERDQTNAVPGGTPSGTVSFSSLTNFLTNIPQSFTSNIPGSGGEVGYRQSIFGIYVQDDWHILRNLTLNLGLRYEISTVPTEQDNRLTTLTNLTSPTLHLGSPLFNNPTLHNFSPRVGFAWDPFKDGKTAIRAAFGQYDVLPLVYEYLLSSILSAPYLEQGSIATPPAGSFPGGLYGSLTPSSLRTQWIEQNPKRSYVLEWNLNIQRDIGAGTIVQLGYTGSHGVRLTFTTSNANIVQPIATAQGYIWPANGTVANPKFGTITPTLWQVSSSYQALQARISRRLTHGFQIQGSYTWGKSIDANSEATTTAFANSLTNLPTFDPRVRRGLSDFDIRHNFVANLLWDIPGPHRGNAFINWVGGGWQLGEILQLSSGLPFTPLISGDPLNSKLTTFNFDQPDRLALPECNNPVNGGNPNQYINLSCFVAPTPANRLGNAGRNIIISPGLVNLDSAFYKNNHIRMFSEDVNVQFRAELFNILNHTNFAPPNATNVLIFATTGTGANSVITPIPSSGALTSTATTSRQIQFALKVTW
ncbi:MAG: TonB-dependent receptor [Acidobacteriaceae bacterium]|nr:TonB-dependent receptor [Acidobacteriaceae bacterium]